MQNIFRYFINFFFAASIFSNGYEFICAQQVTSVKIETGLRQTGGLLNSSKFNEYRDVPSGIFGQRLSIGFMNIPFTNAISLFGTNIAQKDQKFTAQLGLNGHYKGNIEWDQIPHNYTNTARTIFTGAGSNALEISDELQKRLEAISTPAVIANIVRGIAHPVEMVSTRDRLKTSFKYKLNDEFDLGLNYINEHRSGKKPLGGSFYFHTPVELIEPTEYRTQEANVFADYKVKDWNMQIDYTFSLFNNKFDVLVWDNLFRRTDQAGKPSRGRLDLFPNNNSHRISMSSAINLPFSTRITTALLYGIRKQNDPFIPFTTNTALDTLPNYPTLPSESLNGKIENRMINILLINRWFSNLWFTFGYRYFEYLNKTPSFIFAGYILQDASVKKIQRRNLRVDYRKINFTSNITLHLLEDLSIKSGFEREEWNRKIADAAKTYENFLKTSLTYSLQRWILLRSSYSLSKKGFYSYNWENVRDEIYPAGLPLNTLGQLSMLRRFDLADRWRNLVNVYLQLSPIQIATLTGFMGYTNDRFGKSEYGLQFSKSYNYGTDVTFNLSKDLFFTIRAVNEKFEYRIKSRQRRYGIDSMLNDWQSSFRNIVYTPGFSLFWSAVPDEIDISLDFNYSDSKGVVLAQALGNPLDTMFIIRENIENYPNTRSIFRQLQLSISYHLTERFTPRFEYLLESYSESYFNQDIMEQYMIDYDRTSISSVYLGVRQPRFAVHWFYIGLVYNF